MHPYSEVSGRDRLGGKMGLPNYVRDVRAATDSFVKAMSIKPGVPARERSHWVPDKESKQCEGCSAAFGLMRRRHHCRVCGGVFCDACTKDRVAVYEQRSPQRVCAQCGEVARASVKEAGPSAAAADTAAAVSGSVLGEFDSLSHAEIQQRAIAVEEGTSGGARGESDGRPSDPRRRWVPGRRRAGGRPGLEGRARLAWRKG